MWCHLNISSKFAEVNKKKQQRFADKHFTRDSNNIHATRIIYYVELLNQLEWNPTTCISWKRSRNIGHNDLNIFFAVDSFNCYQMSMSGLRPPFSSHFIFIIIIIDAVLSTVWNINVSLIPAATIVNSKN